MLFKCYICGKTYEYGSKVWKCSCGGYLKLEHTVKFHKSDIDASRFNMWRYDKAYPLKYNEIDAAFDEGLTPFVSVNWDGFNIKVKMDSLMPTCSFKDRGMVMAVNYLKNFGADLITEDSSGNAAASVAAYCAKGGIKCKVFVPEGNSSGKIVQAKAYGAEINAVKGSREDVADAAQVFTESYAGHNWHPMFAAGLKSIAYEIWEQSGFNAPDAVIVPCGGGSLTLGLADGFKELLDNGEIPAIPKIIAVQPANCNPIARRFEDDKSEFIPSATLAEGTNIAKPVKAGEIIESVRFSGGKMVSVPEGNIKPALIKACKKGIYIEPTSAIAFAAFDILMGEGYFNGNENIVIVASGNGLKVGDAVKALTADSDYPTCS